MASASRKVLSIGSLEYHGDFEKQILAHGTGDVKPNRGSVCICIIKIANVHKVDLSKKIFWRYNFGEQITVTIGDEDSNLSRFFDKVLMSMTKGEHAYIKSMVDAFDNKEWVRPKQNGEFKFNISLQSFQRSSAIEDLKWSERVKLAQDHMDQGSELIKIPGNVNGIWKYETAIEYLRAETVSNKPPDELHDQHHTLLVQCHLILADTMISFYGPNRVIEHCNAVLELDNKSTKALFLRGQAYFCQHKFTEARADFASVRHIEPQNIEANMRIAHIDRRSMNELQHKLQSNVI